MFLFVRFSLSLSFFSFPFLFLLSTNVCKRWILHQGLDKKDRWIIARNNPWCNSTFKAVEILRTNLSFLPFLTNGGKGKGEEGRGPLTSGRIKTNLRGEEEGEGGRRFRTCVNCDLCCLFNPESLFAHKRCVFCHADGMGLTNSPSVCRRLANVCGKSLNF